MSNTIRTPQQAYKDAKESGAIDAWMEGKKIECKEVLRDDPWQTHPLLTPHFTSPAFIWRPAPTPRLRPWKPEDVPVGAITKAHGDELSASMIVGYSEQGVFLAQDNGAYPFGDLLRFRKHSLDGGKTWAPCGVLEGGE